MGLGLGAPLEMVQASMQAMADETEHARLAFGLASAYAGHALGPSELDTTGAILATTLEACAITAFLEGCVGETVAALDAAEALEHACDPAVRRVLETIVRDETRHAELAWRFVQWALQHSGPSLSRHLAITFERLSGDQGAVFEAPTKGSALAAHGLLSSNVSAALRRCALSNVVGPCLSALLNSVRAAGPAGHDGFERVGIRPGAEVGAEIVGAPLPLIV